LLKGGDMHNTLQRETRGICNHVNTFKIYDKVRPREEVVELRYLCNAIDIHQNIFNGSYIP